MPTEYTQSQYGRVVLSTDRRKHLNLILEDRSVENSKTYGWNYLPTGFSIRSSKAANKGELGRDTGDSGRIPWESAEQDGASPSELALKVRNRRTPSGQFYTSINTALIDKPAPVNTYEGEYLSKEAYVTMRAPRSPSFWDDGAGASAGHSYAPSAMPSPTASPSLAHISFGTSTASDIKPAPWLMPWETGDRVTGRKVADQVRNRRTPSGSFSIMTLAKASK